MLDDVERILGEPDGKYFTDALNPSTVNAYEYEFGDGVIATMFCILLMTAS